MPIYDFKCPKCEHYAGILMSFKDYDEFTKTECEKCGESITKDDREICTNIKANIVGVSKGNYNSGDWS